MGEASVNVDILVWSEGWQLLVLFSHDHSTTKNVSSTGIITTIIFLLLTVVSCL